jgi:hypothetical protein
MPRRQVKETHLSALTRQTWQALEFVTITNPDEIKDPIKQKAIRQRARRRDHGSKAFRKPIPIIFDLPAANIQADTEHSVIRRQLIAASYYVLEHKYSERNVAAPSLEFLRPISNGGGGLLFASSFSPEMSSRAGKLVNFSKI